MSWVIFLFVLVNINTQCLPLKHAPCWKSQMNYLFAITEFYWMPSAGFCFSHCCILSKLWPPVCKFYWMPIAILSHDLLSKCSTISDITVYGQSDRILFYKQHSPPPPHPPNFLSPFFIWHDFVTHVISTEVHDFSWLSHACAESVARKGVTTCACYKRSQTQTVSLKVLNFWKFT